jgi:protein-tyrosine-phosphatase
VFGPATLTGEVAMDTAHDEDNLAIGGSVSYKLTDKVTLRGKATRKAENIVDPYGKRVAARSWRRLRGESLQGQR